MFNSISKKVMVGYAAVLLLLLITAVFLYRESNIVFELKESFVQKTLPALRAVEETSSSLNGIQIASFGLYGTTLNQGQFDEQAARFEEILSTKLNELKRAGLGNTSELENRKQQMWNHVDQLKANMSSGSIDWDAARSQLNAIQMEMDSMRQLLEQFKGAASRQANEASDNISAELSVMRGLIIFSVLSIAFITLVAFTLSQRKIAQPVKDLSKQLDKIAAESDLSEDVAVVSSDEVGEAATSVNQLLSAFREGNKEIQQSSSEMLNSVNQLNHSARLSEAQVTTFSKHVRELLQKIDSLENCIEQSANRSLDAAETAKTGAGQVKEGADSVARTSDSIADLARDVEKSAEMLLSLKNAGDQVSSVVKTIAEIAEQTNLLALNAAIEAARAGESGRGFAVVADEVRTLASRTHDSTHEINTILDKIVESISSTVTTMDSNKAKATESVELAESTVTSLDAIQNTVISLSDENHQLADLAQDIKTNATAMRGSVDQIGQATEGVTESSKETRSVSDAMSEIAARLSSVVNRFKV